MRTGIVIFLLVLCSTAYAQETHLLAASDTLPHAFMAPAPPHSLVAQDDLATPINLLPPPGQIDWGRFGISSGVLAASIVGLHILQNNSWWANQRQSFHIYDDPIYQANFDKFGHMFGAYYTSHFFNEAFTWSNLDSAQADLLGALCGAMYEFYVEIEDGYAHDWGFSPGDATGDLVGATFFLLRNRIDFLRNFQYKWFYYPSPQ